jgi:hypothetical protein
MAVAEVLFLNNVRGDGYEGPFDLKAPLQSLLDFDMLPLPRRAGIGTEHSSSEEKKGGSDGKGDESKSKTRPLGKRRTYSGGLEKHLDGKRGAGLDEVMASASGERETRQSLESAPAKPWKDLFPKYEKGELILYYDRYNGEWRWWRVWVEAIILPTETQYRDGMVDIMYQLSPHPMENIGNTRLLIKEYRLREYRRERQDYGKPQILTSLPTRLDPLHSMDAVGIDTCSALSVSTRKEDFLFLDSSVSARNSVVLRGVGGSDARTGGEDQ